MHSLGNVAATKRSLPTIKPVFSAQVPLILFRARRSTRTRPRENSSDWSTSTPPFKKRHLLISFVRTPYQLENLKQYYISSLERVICKNTFVSDETYGPSGGPSAVDGATDRIYGFVVFSMLIDSFIHQNYFLHAAISCCLDVLLENC